MQCVLPRIIERGAYLHATTHSLLSTASPQAPHMGINGRWAFSMSKQFRCKAEADNDRRKVHRYTHPFIRGSTQYRSRVWVTRNSPRTS